MKYQISLVAAIVISIGIAVAQETSIQETNAASLKFYQINTPFFKILYPEGFEIQAQRMANTLDRIHEPEAKTMGVSPAKISIVMQNQSAISNAFVTLAPRRSEFYAMPPQNYNFLGTNDWLNLLSSHEYRHIVQFQRSRVGFNRFFYYLFGQQATAGFAGAAAPQWFWEGDAVATETAFTRSGRGKIPNFNLLFRTNFLEGRTFNYHKQYLRSYKHKIPDHYVLGYHMVSYLRKKTNDPEIWEKIARQAWSYPFIPFTFSNAIHHRSGKYVTGLFNEMQTTLTEQWKKEVHGLTLTPFEKIHSRSSTAYTDYFYPQVLSNGDVIVQKSGIGDIDQLTVIKDGKEKKVFVQGIVNETGMMSAAGSRVVWNEYRFDPRWQVHTYSIIKGYDISSGKAHVISTTSRYAGAALSPDGRRVVTVETGTDYKTRLVILDYETGAILTEIPNPNNDFIAMPRFTLDGERIIALTTNAAGKTISMVTIATGEVSDLLPRGNENFGYPIDAGKYVLYNSPYSNIDNLYALELATGKRFQVTSSKYGAYNPAVAPDGKSILYNEQGRDGMEVVRAPFEPTRWTALESVKKGEGFYQHLVEQEGRPHLLDSVPNKMYAVKRYRRAAGMINPHSWGPYFTNTFAQANVGIYSQDVLSTTSISGGYQYDINEKTGSYQAGVSYQGFYPILDFQVMSGKREDNVTTNAYTAKFNWDETTTSGGIRIPFNFTRSKYYSQATIGNTVSLTHISSFQSRVNRGDTIVRLDGSRYVPYLFRDSDNKLFTADYLLRDKLTDGNLVSNHFYVTWFHAMKTSTRDFNPKFGQYFYFDLYNTPFGGKFNGNQWLGRTILFFPGLAKHHSLFFRAGYQQSYSSVNDNTYTFRNHLFRPRGYAYPTDDKFTTVSANYQLPVWYPDIALGPILNIQRVKANFFCDGGKGSHYTYFYVPVTHQPYIPQLNEANYLSYGAEITFDINVMRLLQQIEVGFRVTTMRANVYNNAGSRFEFLIGNIPF